MEAPTPSLKLALEVLIQGLQENPEFAMTWAHAVAAPFVKAGMPAPAAYTAAGNFMNDTLRTFVFSHQGYPLCQDAVNKAVSTLQYMGWEYRNEAWRAPAEPIVGIDLGKSGGDHTAIATFKQGDDGRPVLESIEHFDEARADAIGQNGNDGEHYDAIAKAEDEAVFKAAAEKVIPEPAGLRRSDKPKPRQDATLPDTSSLVDATGRPRWADLPKWVNWLAQTRGGVWFGFANKPEARTGGWFSTKRWTELNSGEPAFAHDYLETLEQRP